MHSAILSLMQHPLPSWNKVQMALNFFVSVPAFQFFAATGSVGRTGRVVGNNRPAIFEICLIAAVFLGLPLGPLNDLNSVSVIVGSVSLTLMTFRKSGCRFDVTVFRVGLVTIC